MCEIPLALLLSAKDLSKLWWAEGRHKPMRPARGSVKIAVGIGIVFLGLLDISRWSWGQREDLEVWF